MSNQDQRRAGYKAGYSHGVRHGVVATAVAALAMVAAWWGIDNAYDTPASETENAALRSLNHGLLPEERKTEPASSRTIPLDVASRQNDSEREMTVVGGLAFDSVSNSDTARDYIEEAIDQLVNTGASYDPTSGTMVGVDRKGDSDSGDSGDKPWMNMPSEGERMYQDTMRRVSEETAGRQGRAFMTPSGELLWDNNDSWILSSPRGISELDRYRALTRLSPIDLNTPMDMVTIMTGSRADLIETRGLFLAKDLADPNGDDVLCFKADNGRAFYLCTPEDLIKVVTRPDWFVPENELSSIEIVPGSEVYGRAAINSFLTKGPQEDSQTEGAISSDAGARDSAVTLGKAWENLQVPAILIARNIKDSSLLFVFEEELLSDNNTPFGSEWAIYPNPRFIEIAQGILQDLFHDDVIAEDFDEGQVDALVKAMLDRDGNFVANLLKEEEPSAKVRELIVAGAISARDFSSALAVLDYEATLPAEDRVSDEVWQKLRQHVIHYTLGKDESLFVPIFDYYCAHYEINANEFAVILQGLMSEDDNPLRRIMIFEMAQALCELDLRQREQGIVAVRGDENSPATVTEYRFPIQEWSRLNGGGTRGSYGE